MSETSTLQIEQPVDLGRAVRLVARRKRWVAGVGVLGLLAGLAYGRLQPSRPTAEALVVLPPATTDSSGTVDRSMATEAFKARSSMVLTAALASHPVHRPVTVGELRRAVQAKAVTPDILAIKVTDASGDDAVSLANAVASAYTSQYNEPETTPAGQAVAQAQKDATSLATLVASLQKLTAEASSASPDANAGLLASIRDELTQVSSAIDALANSTATLDVNGSGFAQVLQPATSATVPPAWRLLIMAGIGLVAGLIIGLIVAYSLGRRDRRLRRRAEIESALGLPVLASINTRACHTPSEWEGVLLDSGSDPLLAWNLHRLLIESRNTGEPGSTGIDVITFAGDGPALSVGPRLAVHSASTGVATVLTTNSVSELQDLRAATVARRDEPTGGPLTIETDEVTDSAEFAVGVRVVDADRVVESDLTPRKPAVVAVSAGVVTADDLARLALAVNDTGGRILGFVLVNPDPSDSHPSGPKETVRVKSMRPNPEAVGPDAAGLVEESAEEISVEPERTP